MGGCETGRGEVGGVRDDCKQRGKWAVECSSRVLQPQMFDNRVELEYGLSRDSCRGPMCFRLGNSPGVMALKRVRDGGGWKILQATQTMPQHCLGRKVESKTWKQNKT